MKASLSVLLSFVLLAAMNGGGAAPTAAAAPAAETVPNAAIAPAPVQFGANIELSGSLPASLFQREPTIASNPKNPLNLVAGFFGRGVSGGPQNCWFVSTADAGTTWTLGGAVPLNGSFDLCADPALAADAKGNFYYSYLNSNITSQGVFRTNDVRVAKSIDGGKTFPKAVTVVVGGETAGTPLPDKDYIAVDTRPKSPFIGNIYVTYTDFPATNNLIAVTISRDSGKTWSAPTTLENIDRTRPITAQTWLTGSQPVVAPDGSVFVFYTRASQAVGITASIRFVKSKDGGRTWSQPADAAANLPTPGFYNLNDGTPTFGTSSGFGVSVTVFPTAAIAPDGTLYVVWTDFPNGSCTRASVASSGHPSCVNSDVRLATSTDGGATWSSPVKVSDDATSTDQFFPWIAIGPDGLLSLIWLDRRSDPNNVNYDAYYTNTADGRNFLPNVKISSATSIVDDTYNGGDYNNLVVTSQGIFAVWNDTRYLTPDVPNSRVFFAKGVPTP